MWIKNCGGFTRPSLCIIYCALQFLFIYLWLTKSPNRQECKKAKMTYNYHHRTSVSSHLANQKRLFWTFVVLYFKRTYHSSIMIRTSRASKVISRLFCTSKFAAKNQTTKPEQWKFVDNMYSIMPLLSLRPHFQPTWDRGLSIWCCFDWYDRNSALAVVACTSAHFLFENIWHFEGAVES